jgi:hypothetical protein
MLLTDGTPNTQEDLRVYESSILDVSHTEGIELNAKLGLAVEEVSEDILDFLIDQGASADPHTTTRRSIGTSDVVVTSQLKRWHAVHTLEVVYRDAFNNQLNDRYKDKFREYHELSRNARDHTFRFGVGVVLTPLPEAAQPLLSFAAGQVFAATYYVQVTWTSADGQEGAPSTVTTFDTPPGGVLVVTAQNPPMDAVAFNVYAGTTPETVTLQNFFPVPAGSSFTMPESGLVSGVPPGTGQVPDVYVSGTPVMKRG